MLRGFISVLGYLSSLIPLKITRYVASSKIQKHPRLKITRNIWVPRYYIRNVRCECARVWTRVHACVRVCMRVCQYHSSCWGNRSSLLSTAQAEPSSHLSPFAISTCSAGCPPYILSSQNAPGPSQNAPGREHPEGRALLQPSMTEHRIKTKLSKLLRDQRATAIPSWIPQGARAKAPSLTVLKIKATIKVTAESFLFSPFPPALHKNKN